ncbi:MAG: hypothetical protein ACTSYR_02110 [Candidatus Odinarchaeia archaeon]
MKVSTLDVINSLEFTYLKPLDDTFFNKLRFYIDKGVSNICTLPYNIINLPHYYHQHLKLVTVANFPFGFVNYTFQDLEELPAIFHAIDIVLPIPLLLTNSVDELKEWVKTHLDILDEAFKNAESSLREVRFIIELGLSYNLEPVVRILENENAKRNYNLLVKTNTGFIVKTSFEEKLNLVKKLSSMTVLPIKVSGGIRTIDQCKKLLEVPRVIYIGTSQIKEIENG